MNTRAERRRMAFGSRVAVQSRASQQLVLKLAAVALASFAVSLAAGSMLPAVFPDARSSAIAGLSLWAVIPVMFGLMVSSSKPRSWKGWGGATLVAGAGWSAAAGLSAVVIEDFLVGPAMNVFAAVFFVTFLPMVLIVALAGIVVRMRRLLARQTASSS